MEWYVSIFTLCSLQCTRYSMRLGDGCYVAWHTSKLVIMRQGLITCSRPICDALVMFAV